MHQLKVNKNGKELFSSLVMVFPLSFTLGEKSSVRYTEFEFSSDIVNGGSSSEWKYVSPLAMPITIFIRRVQDSWHPSPSMIHLKS